MVIQGRLANLTPIYLFGGYTVMHFSHKQLVFLELLTPGGGGPPAQTTLTLNWSTLEELGEPTTMLKEDQQKEFVYLTIQTISQTQLTSLLQCIKLLKVWFRELNMKLTMVSLEIHYKTYTTTMHHVLSVMFLPELELS